MAQGGCGKSSPGTTPMVTSELVFLRGDRSGHNKGCELTESLGRKKLKIRKKKLSPALGSYTLTLVVFPVIKMLYTYCQSKIHSTSYGSRTNVSQVAKGGNTIRILYSSERQRLIQCCRGGVYLISSSQSLWVCLQSPTGQIACTN
jgi:hypothetical protein